MPSLIDTIKFSIENTSPLYIGGEKGIRPSMIDLKVYRRIEYDRERKDFIERIVIPGSTIKGVLRNLFEDIIRQYVLEKYGDFSELLKAMIHGFISTIAGMYYIYSGGRDVVEYTINILRSEPQIYSIDLLSTIINSSSGTIYHELKNNVMNTIDDAINNLNPPKDLRSELEKRKDILSTLIIQVLSGLFPFVCDPTLTSMSETSDVAIIDIMQDRSVAFKILLNIALARKTPLIEEVCPVCILFGSPGRTSPLIFTDLIVEEPSNVNPILPVRARVSIDRELLVAKHGKLFIQEYIPPGYRFSGEIHVNTTLLPGYYRKGDTLQYRKVLRSLLSMLNIRSIGGMKSIGMGLVKVLNIDNNVPLSPDSAYDEIKKFIESIVMKRCKALKDKPGKEELIKDIVMKLRYYGLDLDVSSENNLKKALDLVMESQASILKSLSPGDCNV